MLFFVSLPLAAHAITLRVNADALQRTLTRQLFARGNGRFYLRGTSDSPCYAYAEDPAVHFEADRVVIHVTLHARLGTTLGRTCFGVTLNTGADVSVLPFAAGDTLSFRDPQLEHLENAGELGFLLVPFLSRKLPQTMSLNASTLFAHLLSRSAETTGYDLKIDGLQVTDLRVENDFLVATLDGALFVR